MKRFTTLFALVLLAAVGGIAQAQETAKPGPEVGFRGGLTVYRGSGNGISIVSIPGDNGLFASTVYLMMFARPTLAIEPQVGLMRVGTENGSSGLFTGAIQLNQFFSDPSAGSVFGLLNVGFTTDFGDDDSDSIFAAGGGAGYRTIVREALGVRLEGRYRRLFGDVGGTNEFSILVGLGAVLGN